MTRRTPKESDPVVGPALDRRVVTIPELHTYPRRPFLPAPDLRTGTSILVLGFRTEEGEGTGPPSTGVLSG